MNKKLLAVLMSLSVIVSMIGGCSGLTKNEDIFTEPDIIVEEETEKKTEPTTEEATSEATQRDPGSGQIINVDFKPGFDIAGEPYKPLSITPAAPSYTLNADLSNIENMNQFTNLTEEQRALIAANGFVVIPNNTEQLFYIYEDNSYKKIPNFITTDSVLQLYHIYYDYSLRNLETDYLSTDLASLNANMITQLMTEYESSQDSEIQDKILKMVAYFSVAGLCLGEKVPSELPATYQQMANKEYELIQAADGKTESPIFDFTVDYSLFKVRGHYTRSDILGQYFQAMSWYGIIPMPFEDEVGNPVQDTATDAIIMTLALCRLPAKDGIRLWENIYSTTSFYVGSADDLTPYEVAQAIVSVYGDTPNVDDIPDKRDEFITEIKSMREAQIVSKAKDAQTGIQMRFMGQRYIPDSEILQNLCDYEKRPFPSGLDVFAVYGSERAEELLDEIYQPAKKWDKYQENFDKMAKKFREQTVEEQTSNLYTGWLYSLKSLTGHFTEGYPTFMQNSAWEDKSLSTALGSWAELRHDTILYGKQSSAECGGNEPPKDIMGYVEPNIEFYNRLLWLTKMTNDNLESRGFLNEDMSYKGDDIIGLLEFLRDCSEKELKGEALSSEELSSLLTYGGTLEYISSSIAEASDWFLVESETDRNMASIADVHTAGDSYLEVGVGTAAEIYVATQQNGSIYLTRGAVFDYFEFTTNERLTDEEWQSSLENETPERPPFTSSYMDEQSGGEVPVPDNPYSSGC